MRARVLLESVGGCEPNNRAATMFLVHCAQGYGGPGPTVALAATPRAVTKAEGLLARLKPWSTDDLRQIIDTAPTYKTMARWARAMDVASDHPEEFLSTAQIASESGMSINEWRDAPRKLPQHLTAHCAANIEWPLAGVGGRELGKDDQV